MRIIKPTEPSALHTEQFLNRIASVAINTKLNCIVVQDGVVCDELVPRYNTYELDNMIVDIACTNCYVAVVGPFAITGKFVGQLKRVIIPLLDKVFEKFPDLNVNYSECSEQYVSVSETDSFIKQGHSTSCQLGFNRSDLTANSVWNRILIYEASDLNKFIYIPELSSSSVISPNHRLASLSTVIVDLQDTFNLPDGYCSPDMPLRSQYSDLIQKHLSPHVILLDACLGIDLEIAKHYCNNVARWRVYSVNALNRHGATYPIYWLKWENVNPVTVPDSMDRYAAVQHQLFVPVEKTEDTEYRCFITGAPIYGDCYALDVYYYNSVPQGTGSKKLTRGAQNTPRHLLISPAAACRLYGGKHCVRNFEKLTDTRVIAYRTYCPTVIDKVIDRLPTHDEQYKQALRALASKKITSSLICHELSHSSSSMQRIMEVNQFTFYTVVMFYTALNAKRGTIFRYEVIR